MKELVFDQQFIDTYLTKRHLLSSVEIALFEKQLAQNETLTKEVKRQQEIIGGINYYFDKALKQKLKDSDKK